MQRIVVDRPPNWGEIIRVFPWAMKGNVFFSYGDTIYNPSNVYLNPALLAHEGLHGERQKVHPGGVEGWWRDYLNSPTFRFEEERLAHIAEVRALKDSLAFPRHQRRGYLLMAAARLASPLYGNLCSQAQARAILKAALREVGEDT